MITSLFYYGHYRPYILDQAETDNTTPRRPKILESYMIDGKSLSVLLNKARKRDIIKYARGVSTSVLSLKESTNDSINDMEGYNENAYRRGSSKAKEWLANDLRRFTEAYNNSSEFMSEQAHSQELRGFAQVVTDGVDEGIGRLKRLGITKNAEGKLDFNPEYFNKLSPKRLGIAIGDNIDLFKNIYNEAANVLTEPLSEHMNFKSLSFYYNYKMGTLIADTFKIIESGMLVDTYV